MSYLLEPYAPELVPAVVDFNRRLAESTEHRGVAIRLPEVSNLAGRQEWRLLVDPTRVVRGAVLLQRERCLVGPAEQEVLNLQSPITEGAVNRAYAAAGPILVRRVLETNPLAYAVGMGSLDSPFARLLQGMRWRVSLVPFLAFALRPRLVVETFLTGDRRPEFLNYLPAGLLTGTGGAMLAAWQASRKLAGGNRGLASEFIRGWPAARDDLWHRVRDEIGFGFVRDSAGLDQAYPPADHWLEALGLRKDTKTAWAVITQGRLANSDHFGQLTVATVLDALADRGLETDLVRQTLQSIRSADADLCIANFTHPRLIAAFRSSGFLTLPSNYVLALSPALASAVGSSIVHVTRGDGDGRVHLLPPR